MRPTIIASTILFAGTTLVLCLPEPASGAPAPVLSSSQISSLPFTISEPGHYIVTSNLTGTSGADGITVEVDDVTLDLCGYTLYGVPGAGSGVRIENGVERVRVLHGGLRAWDSAGILANQGTQCVFEDLFLGENGNQGGINGSAGSLFSECIAHDSVGDGLDGNGRIEACIARSNGLIGIDFGGRVSRCVSVENEIDGINVDGGSVVECSLARENIRDGFSTGAGTSFHTCLAEGNDVHGFDAQSRAKVDDCLSVGSGEHGVFLEDYSSARGNLCADNGRLVATGAGIHASLGWNRLDENALHGNPFGISVASADNTILRNSASQSGLAAYDFVAGNMFLAGGVGAASPWVNFSH